MNPPTLLVFRGLPASGKTTECLAWLREAPGRRARANRDDIRQDVFGLAMTPGHAILDRVGEAAVTAVQEAMVATLLKRGVSVAVDDTNLPDQVVAGWQFIADRYGADLVVRDLRDIPVEECVIRDAARFAAGGRHVGADVIRQIAAAGGTPWQVAL